ncbi:hypothetical protein [Oceanimonas sp. CAM02]|uniref:hypothetical protein n=1 Tax=Oceanimonas sp. CAM02 TaxID=3080336 RepID=UPI0029368ED7|nr:hypothetical protein [Oceanimonas sp. CAM02]MDV2858623.1 hypothetical protein [Oceanimonas sp. CAM02]
MVNASVLLFSLLSTAGSVQDPTRPLAVGPQPVTKADKPASNNSSVPVVQAIFAGGSTPGAIIDGQWVTLGKAVGNYRLLAITKEQVTLENQGKRLILNLFSTFNDTDTP